jgi:hypothetical protein
MIAAFPRFFLPFRARPDAPVMTLMQENAR